jgi:hypothetical protein
VDAVTDDNSAVNTLSAIDIARDYRGTPMKNFNMLTGSYAIPAYSAVRRL